MWLDMVVVLAPQRQLASGVGATLENFLVQVFDAWAPVE
jgi:hypothetical protein